MKTYEVRYLFKVNAEDRFDAARKVDNFLPQTDDIVESYYIIAVKPETSKINCEGCEEFDSYGCMYQWLENGECKREPLKPPTIESKEKIKFEYEVLLKIATDKVNGFTLSDLANAFPDNTKNDVAKNIGELEILGMIRGDWVQNKDNNNRWEMRYFIAGEGTPDFLKTVLEYKEGMFRNHKP